MAVCTVSMDNNGSFLPPVHNGEKKKLFSSLTSKKMFGRFLTSNHNSNKEKPKENDSCIPLCTKTQQQSQNYETERRRPLVLNKENNFNSVDNHQRMNSRSPTIARRPHNNNEVMVGFQRTRREEEVTKGGRNDSPPRLITVSGKLSSAKFRDVIKPIAYKPPTHARMTSSHDCLPIHQANDEGYNSQNMSSSSAATSSSSSSSNTSANFQTDKHTDTMETDNVARQLRYVRPRPKSSTVSCSKKLQCDEVLPEDYGRVSEFQVDDCTTNLGSFQPAVAMQVYHHPARQRSMEEQLNGREVRDMRSRLEINERVMTSVLQAKEREWRKEIEEMEVRWKNKMKWHHEKSFRNEQGLLIEVMELRRENNIMKERLNDSEKDKDTAISEKNEAQKFVQQLKNHLEESHWQTTIKLNEIVSMRCRHPSGKLKTAFSSQNVPESSLSSSSVYEQVNEVEGQFYKSSRRRSLGGKLNPIKSGSRDDTNEYFFSQSDDIISQMEDMKKQNELDHYVWMCEKSKVIDYQKRLQSNYLDACQKNQSLQDEVIRLRRKLEMNSLDCIETESFC